MNPFTHAIRVGISRGWIEFMNSLRAPQDLVFYIGVSGGALAMLVANSDSPVEGTSVLMPSVLLPSILAALLVFGNVIGPAYTIAAEREDGTLLRSKALPYGTTGYATGQVVLNSAGMVPPLAIIIVPSLFLFDSVMSRGAVGVVAGHRAARPRNSRNLADRHYRRLSRQKLQAGWHLGDGTVGGPCHDLRNPRPDRQSLGLGARRRAGVPHVLARSRYADGVPPRLGRNLRAGRFLAHGGGVRRARRVGDRRAGVGTDSVAQNGAT